MCFLFLSLLPFGKQSYERWVKAAIFSSLQRKWWMDNGVSGVSLLNYTVGSAFFVCFVTPLITFFQALYA